MITHEDVKFRKKMKLVTSMSKGRSRVLNGNTRLIQEILLLFNRSNFHHVFTFLFGSIQGGIGFLE